MAFWGASAELEGAFVLATQPVVDSAVPLADAAQFTVGATVVVVVEDVVVEDVVVVEVVVVDVVVVDVVVVGTVVVVVVGVVVVVVVVVVTG